MEGNAYYINLEPFILQAIKPAIVQFSLSLRQIENISILENEHCVLKIFASDIQNYNWSISAKKDSRIKDLSISEYAMIRSNSDIHIGRGKVKRNVDLKTFTMEMMRRFNTEILEFGKDPLKGDFSWADQLTNKKSEIDALKEYAYATLKSHPQRRIELMRKCISNTPGWVEELKQYISEEE